MIKLVENPSKTDLAYITKFAETSCLGVRALGPLLAYGTGYEFLTVWAQKNLKTGRYTALITKFYGDVTVVSGAGADIPEIEEFLTVTGYSSLTCDYKAGDRSVMKLDRGAECIAVPVTNCNWIENSGYKEFYDIILRCHETYLKDGFENWYVDISHRVRHETAGLFLLDAGGTLVSAVAALSVTPHCVFLSAVSTLPEYRGRHYAHTLIRRICEKYEDRTVYLFCKEDKVPFYEKAGFFNAGTVFTEQVKQNGK